MAGLVPAIQAADTGEPSAAQPPRHTSYSLAPNVPAALHHSCQDPHRARVVRDPRGVMAEWGTVLPAGMEVRVIDSTADYRWMVLPMRPAGTEGWSEDELTKLVTRDDLVGVTLPSLRAPVKQAA